MYATYIGRYLEGWRTQREFSWRVGPRVGLCRAARRSSQQRWMACVGDEGHDGGPYIRFLQLLKLPGFPFPLL